MGAGVTLYKYFCHQKKKNNDFGNFESTNYIWSATAVMLLHSFFQYLASKVVFVLLFAYWLLIVKIK